MNNSSNSRQEQQGCNSNLISKQIRIDIQEGAKKLYERGYSVKQIATIYQRTTATIYEYINKDVLKPVEGDENLPLFGVTLNLKTHQE